MVAGARSIRKISSIAKRGSGHPFLQDGMFTESLSARFRNLSAAYKDLVRLTFGLKASSIEHRATDCAASR